MRKLLAASEHDISGKGLSRQAVLQQEWQAYRDRVCSAGDKKCLVQIYDGRLRELAVAALFQVPVEALVELARIDPKTAPIYEAIYRYATIDDSQMRAKIVSQLIDPAFQTLDKGAVVLSSVDDALDAASSDKNFSAFLDVASVSGYPLTMPCMAIVKRPGMIGVMQAAFGGAIDTQLIRTDCEAMTADLTEVDHLVEEAVSVQPECEGTIRFSLGRDLDKQLVAMRLHREDQWHSPLPETAAAVSEPSEEQASDETSEPGFYARRKEETQQATEKLATYYSAYFSVPPDLAKVQARKALGAAIAAAFDLCE